MSPQTRREPAYRALADDIRTGIMEGRFPSGERLPTEAELSKQHAVSRQTVRRAYQDLVADGIVHRIPGKGTFPRTRGEYLRSFGSIEELLSLSLDTILEILEPLQFVDRPDAAAALGLQFDSVAEVTFRRLHDGLPFCVTTVSLPAAIGQRLRDLEMLTTPNATSSTTMLALLSRALDKPFAGAKQTITAVAAPANLAHVIDCEPNQPVMRIERLYFDLDGRPVEYAVNHFNPERYSYRLQLQRTNA
jgi:GntR family transcriptional regulator